MDEVLKRASEGMAPNCMVLGHKTAYHLGIRRVLNEDDGRYYIWNEEDEAFTTLESPDGA